MVQPDDKPRPTQWRFADGLRTKKVWARFEPKVRPTNRHRSGIGRNRHVVGPGGERPDQCSSQGTAGSGKNCLPLLAHRAGE